MIIAWFLHGVPSAAGPRGPSPKLLEAGLVKEIRAKGDAPIWRRDEETGQTYKLKLTAAGAKAVALDDATRFESKKAGRVDHLIVSVDPEPGSDPAAAVDRPNSGVTGSPTSPRSGTKIAQVIELLQRGDGATRRTCRRHRLAAAHDTGSAHWPAQARLRRRD